MFDKVKQTSQRNFALELINWNISHLTCDNRVT